MTYFLRSGARFNVSTQAAMDLHQNLPVGTYTVKLDQRSGSFYLEAIESFVITGKVYGDTQKRATRILNTFQDRPGSTGVMLSGEKGSGKTLLAKMISLDGQLLGMPTIVINQPWCGEEFNVFMQMIEQPAIVIFDEFEKVYDNEDQEKLLTLLDGVYPSKKLFIITCNDKWRVDSQMRNRPGRIFYRIEYSGLAKEFIEEYCRDNLENEEYIESVCRIAVMFSEFNFDILKAMVEEMNRYGETPQEVMQVLNAKPEQAERARYDLTLRVGGETIPPGNLSSVQWHGNPLREPVLVRHLAAEPVPDEDGDLDYWIPAEFTVTDLKGIDSTTGEFYFVNSAGDSLGLTKAIPPVYNWEAF